MKLPLLVFLLCAIAKGAIQNCDFGNFGYYWRYLNSSNSIPHDAVPGSINAEGQTTYIGRSIHYPIGALIPGTVYPETNKLFHEYLFVEYEKTQFVEILCALNHNRLEWVDATNGIKSILEIGDLVMGGQVGTVPIYIGRKKSGHEIQVGKVFLDFMGNNRMYMVLNKYRKCWIEREGIEVLVYDKNESVHSDGVTVRI